MKPTRREFFHIGAAAGAGLFGGWSLATAAQPQRTNVVMIVSDDQSWYDFGFMGHRTIQTPRLDRLARQSAVFPNGYVPTSLCRASLATLLTGLYPHQHHICCNDPPRGVDRKRMHPFMRRAPALPRLLAKRGYRSLQTGKFWEGHYSNAGFTAGQTTNSDRHIARKQPQIGRATMQPIYDFVDKNRTNPFFVWYAPMMPHTPHNPPERILKRYRGKVNNIHLARYYAMCEWFDETCGQLLDYLDRRRLTDNTLVVFVVDNGWVQPLKPKRPLPFDKLRGKRTPYEAGIRTPIMLRWPRHTKPGRYNDLVITIDLAPTILTAAGMQPPRQMTGLNLLNVAAGKGRLNRNAVFGEVYLHDCTKLGQPQLDVTHQWVREGDWKLIVPRRAKNKTIELFNLAKDPHEHTNLAGREAKRVKRLQQRIQKWVASR